MPFDEQALNGLKNYLLSEEFYFILGITVVGAIVYFLMRRYINPLLIKVISRKNKNWAPIFKKSATLRPLAYLAPIVILMACSQHVPLLWRYIEKPLGATVAVLLTLLSANLIHAANGIYETYPISKEKPVKSYAQLLILVVYILGAIIAICRLLDSSPAVFLGGAVAVMAAILLVFRDTILSFIASMQLAANQLIKKGDWIEIPAFGADGNVIDIALHVVRIQNFDNTIVTVPTYKIMELGFRNWRGMYESGARQIKKSILIDQNSIRFMSEANIKELYQHKDMQKNLPTYKEVYDHIKNSGITNLGVFRMYAMSYLRNHPQLHQERLMMVRMMDPTPNGVPLQIYTYSNDTRWVIQEQVQASILEHLIARLKDFDLRVYQNMKDTDGEFPAPMRTWGSSTNN